MWEIFRILLDVTKGSSDDTSDVTPNDIYITVKWAQIHWVFFRIRCDFNAKQVCHKPQLFPGGLGISLNYFIPYQFSIIR